MTEGIIQKVFDNYLSRIDNMPWDKKDLNDLQQELIEEIKKWIFDAKTCGHDLDKQDLDTSCQECLEDLTTLHDLIGDNQE